MKPRGKNRFLNIGLLQEIVKAYLVEEHEIENEYIVNEVSNVVIESYKKHLLSTTREPTIADFKEFFKCIDFEALIRDAQVETMLSTTETLKKEAITSLNEIKKAVENGYNSSEINDMIDYFINRIEKM